MTLEYQVESLDGVPEAMREMYAEKDGKFVLSVNGLPEQPDVSGLKSALAAERERAKTADNYEKLGMSPDEIKKLLQREEQRKTKKLEEEGNYQALLAQHQQKYEEDLTAAGERATAAETALRNHVSKEAFVSELAKHGVSEQGIDLLPDKFKHRIKVTMADDGPVIEIMKADGVTPMAGTAEGGVASLGDLVDEARKKYNSLFNSAIKPGGGMQPSGGSTAKQSRKFREMNGEELKALLHKDPAEYARLKAEHDAGR